MSAKTRRRETKKNILYYPIIDIRYASEQGSEKLIGDLHANGLTAYNTFIQDSILQATPANYKQFTQKFIKPASLLKKDDKACIDDVINKQTKVLPSGLFRFVGDDFADRIGYDLCTLKVDGLLDEHKDKVDYKTLFSNHILALLMSRERNGRYEPYDISDEQSPSIIGLQKLIDNGIITKEKVDALVDKVIEHLLLIDIGFSQEDPEGECSIVYFHGKIDDTDIEAMAKQLGVICDLSDKKNKIKTIKDMNAAFKLKVKNKELHTLVPTQQELAEMERTKQDLKIKYPIYAAIWKRHSGNYKDIHKAFTFYVTGHDGAGFTRGERIVDMDNLAGKDSILEYDNVYRIFEQSSPQVLVDIAELQNELIANTHLCKYLVNNPEEIRKLISDKNIYSSAQIKQLKAMLFNEGSVTLWSELIDDNNKNKFMHAAINKKYPILDVLAQLKSSGILTKVNFERLLKHTRKTEAIYNILLVLMQTNDGLLNQKNFDLVMTNINRLAPIQDVFLECRENETLNNDSIKAIIKNSKRPSYYEKLRLCNLIKYFMPGYLKVVEALDEETVFKIQQILERFRNNIPLNNNLVGQLIHYCLNNLKHAVEMLDEKTVLKICKSIEFFKNYSALNNEKVMQLLHNYLYHFPDLSQLVNNLQLKNMLTPIVMQALVQLPAKQLASLNTFLNDQRLVLDEAQTVFVINRFELFIFLMDKMKFNSKQIARLSYLDADFDYLFQAIKIQSNMKMFEKGKEPREVLNRTFKIFERLHESENEHHIKLFDTDTIDKLFTYSESIYLLFNQFRKSGILDLPVINSSIALCGLSISKHELSLVNHINDQLLKARQEMTLQKLEEEEIEDNLHTYIFQLLPLLSKFDLLNAENITSTIKDINNSEEIFQLISVFSPEPNRLNQNDLNSVMILASDYTGVISVLSQYHLLENKSIEALSLRTKYFNALVNHPKEMMIITEVLLHYLINNTVFLSIFLDNLQDITRFIRGFTLDEQHAENFTNDHIIPHLKSNAQFAKFLTSQTTHYSQSSSSRFSFESSDDKSEDSNDNSETIFIPMAHKKS